MVVQEQLHPMHTPQDLDEAVYRLEQLRAKLRNHEWGQGPAQDWSKAMWMLAQWVPIGSVIGAAVFMVTLRAGSAWGRQQYLPISSEPVS
mmetsp:Transcript_9166/g.14080  ORF Transcript_9166/g.14080 Transcript_9166/m.14080 type:complete len:90 (-) Transcript_9166:523-792(-)